MTREAQKFVSYLRVSTQRQGRSGLGLEAQRASVKQLVAARGGRIIAPEFIEVETGKRDDRPELAKALARCDMTGATLIIARLDRLSRNATFLLRLRDEGARFICADMPDANNLTIGILALVAEQEGKWISERTTKALAEAKKRGTKMGGFRANAPDIRKYQKKAVAALRGAAIAWSEKWRGTIAAMRAEGLSCAAIAKRLNEEGAETRNGLPWKAMTVHRTLARLGL